MATRRVPIERIGEADLRTVVMRTFAERRWTQDSPVVPQVWVDYLVAAERRAWDGIEAPRARRAAPSAPNEPVHSSETTVALRRTLLLTPWTGTTPDDIAARLRANLDPKWASVAREAIENNVPRAQQPAEDSPLLDARIATSSSRVIADLTVEELVEWVVPMSGWWRDLVRTGAADRLFQAPAAGDQSREAAKVGDGRADLDGSAQRGYDELRRYVVFVHLIRLLAACRSRDDYASRARDVKNLITTIRGGKTGPNWTIDRFFAEAVSDVVGVLGRSLDDTGPTDATTRAATRLAWWREIEKRDRALLWLVDLDRTAEVTVFESRRTVKADAAFRVFETDGKSITFAVIDDGIDARHFAFAKPPEETATAKAADDRKEPGTPDSTTIDLSRSRVVATYDFSKIRDILADAGLSRRFKLEDIHTDMSSTEPEVMTEEIRTHLIESLRSRDLKAKAIDWDVVSQLVRVSHRALSYHRPVGDHGTHVAGIMAGSAFKPPVGADAVVGICPQMSLYDLRVFDEKGQASEFSILCAIEFVQWLNRSREVPEIHGVNLSLAIPHRVDSFACGQTPICDACNRLVGAGTVVVAAAGNTGFDDDHQGGDKLSMGKGYRTVSITDPGNAEMVITVGATHRTDPHAYGVSYFSARGPTGDGRRKPDLLAPGEKIFSAVPGGGTKRMDGTSMAAPHVAGAAALLMARHRELIGKPVRIKRILMETATDLGRDRDFQGAGLVDVLRAVQSV